MIHRLRLAFGLLLVLVASVFLLPLQCVCLYFDWRLRRYLPRLWHRLVCYAFGLHIRVHGAPDRRRPLMLASNHSSWLDILVLSAVADVAFIAKIEVRGWPIFGLFARLQKTVFVVREQKRKTGEQVNEIAERMAGGEIVVLFPEGTTSDGNRLLEVKSSLFGAAAAALPAAPEGVVHVQPVAVAYTGIHGMPMGRYHRPVATWPGDIEMLPSLKGVLACGAIDVDVHFGETVDYRADSNRKQVAAEVTERIRALLSGLLLGRHKT